MFVMADELKLMSTASKADKLMTRIKFNVERCECCASAQPERSLEWTSLRLSPTSLRSLIVTGNDDHKTPWMRLYFIHDVYTYDDRR